ncbi:MAG: hypothetical protein K8S55_00510 [Phycisphaerae bacterium]|nr:hypothetical protein [Phycisphaerae bacterium]
MRLAFIIIILTVIAVGLVHLRRREVIVRSEIQRLQVRHLALRREIWDRQLELGHLTTPRAIRSRAETMALNMSNEVPARPAPPEQGRW